MARVQCESDGPPNSKSYSATPVPPNGSGGKTAKGHTEHLGTPLAPGFGRLSHGSVARLEGDDVTT